MEIFLDEVPARAQCEHDVNQRGNQGKQDLENYDIGQSYESQDALAREDSAVLPHRLQNAERPAETLAHQAICRRGSLGVGESHIFVLDPKAAAQQGHGEVSVLRNGVNVEASSLAHGRDSPGANGSRYHANRAQRIESATLEILAGDVFERLPAGPQVHAIANLGVARHRSNFGIEEMQHQVGNGVRSDDRVGINTHEDFGVTNVLDD